MLNACNDDDENKITLPISVFEWPIWDSRVSSRLITGVHKINL